MTDSLPVTPPPYVCDGCGVSDVKLWRKEDSQSSPLLCVNCASADQGLDASSVNAVGLQRQHWFDRDGELSHGTCYDYNIGTLVPAVFDPGPGKYLSRDGFTGHSEQWWRHQMPTR